MTVDMVYGFAVGLLTGVPVALYVASKAFSRHLREQEAALPVEPVPARGVVLIGLAPDPQLFDPTVRPTAPARLYDSTAGRMAEQSRLAAERQAHIPDADRRSPLARAAELWRAASRRLRPARHLARTEAST